MSDITATGTSGYALGSIDTATVLINGVSPRRAQHVNGPAAAVVQIEQILGSGTALKGSMADLVARLAVALNSTGTVKLDGFTGLTTDRGLMAINSTTLQVRNHTPIGVVQAFTGAAAPAEWLLCDGAAVSRSTYAKLFAVVGVTYGAGNGSTTFNVPDLRGRVPIGVDGAANRITAASTNGGNADTLGGAGGTETHTLVTSEIPAHTHTQNTNPADTGAGTTSAVRGTDNGVTNTGSTGGGGAHSNTQPWLALNYIVFAGI